MAKCWYFRGWNVLPLPKKQCAGTVTVALLYPATLKMASASASECPFWIESKEWEILCRPDIGFIKFEKDKELWKNAVETLKQYKGELEEDDFKKLNEEARDELDLTDVSKRVVVQTQEVSFDEYIVSRYKRIGDKKWRYELYENVTRSRKMLSTKAAKQLGDYLMIYNADGDDEWGSVFFSEE
jgi:molecular chaperone DnaK (HSP70)